MNQLKAQLAQIEKKLYTQEHHARLRIGHLDDRYIDLQEQRRNLSLTLFRGLEREIEALRARLAERGVVDVVLTSEGFRVE